MRLARITLSAFIIGMAFALSLATDASANEEILYRENFDTGIDGFELIDIGSGAPSTISWDSSSGNPRPGSLLLVSQETRSSTLFVGPCIEIQPQRYGLLEFTAQVLADERSTNCIAYLAGHQTFDCTDAPDVPGGIVGVPSDEWRSELSVFSGGAYRAIRAGVIQNSSAPGQQCRADSIEIRGVRDLKAVPVMGLLAQAILGVILLLANAWALRRRNSSWSPPRYRE